jgi:hypothetical protein
MINNADVINYTEAASFKIVAQTPGKRDSQTKQHRCSERPYLMYV